MNLIEVLVSTKLLMTEVMGVVSHPKIQCLDRDGEGGFAEGSLVCKWHVMCNTLSMGNDMFCFGAAETENTSENGTPP